MFYVYRVRRLVKIVNDEIEKSTDPVEDDHRYIPNVHHCLAEFMRLNPEKYTDPVARKTFAIATGRKKYLQVQNPSGGSDFKKKLVITADGLILLTPEGYVHALADSVDAPLLIAIIALIVSVLVAIFK